MMSLKKTINNKNVNKISVCILDYGSGNVRSVFNILRSLIVNVRISNSEETIKKSTHLILPGVGAFKASMDKIIKKIPLKIVRNEVFDKKKPFLGICVGMQVLANYGFEFGKYKGLGWISGKVVKINSSTLPLPHVGWNDVTIVKRSQLTSRFTKNQDFYFVHSYIFKPNSETNILATTEYGENFCSIIGKDNIYGVQFHPEKSQKAGKVLLENFLEI